MYPSTTASVQYAADHTTRSRPCDLGSLRQLTAGSRQGAEADVLRVQGDLRRALAPLGVMPLQAGLLCYLQQYTSARLIDVAARFRVEPPTLVDVVQDLV